MARRRSSNTPLQALLLMNDPQYVEAYRALAAAVLRSSEGDTRAARPALSARRARRADAGADRAAARLLSEQRTMFAENEQKAASLLDVGVTQADAELERAALAAMTSVAALVMNSPDAYTVR